MLVSVHTYAYCHFPKLLIFCETQFQVTLASIYTYCYLTTTLTQNLVMFQLAHLRVLLPYKYVMVTRLPGFNSHLYILLHVVRMVDDGFYVSIHTLARIATSQQMTTSKLYAVSIHTLARIATTSSGQSGASSGFQVTHLRVLLQLYAGATVITDLAAFTSLTSIKMYYKLLYGQSFSRKESKLEHKKHR